MTYSSAGVLFSAEVGTLFEKGVLYLRFGANPRIASLIATMNWFAIAKTVCGKNGMLNRYLLVPYTPEIDDQLTALAELHRQILERFGAPSR
jgi:hypothetical protein